MSNKTVLVFWNIKNRYFRYENKYYFTVLKQQSCLTKTKKAPQRFLLKFIR
jgi:hypothetical protein